MVSAEHDRVVLHPSVVAHWWLSSVFHEKAELLRDRLLRGETSAVAVETIDHRGLQAILQAIRSGVPLTAAARTIAEIDVFEEIEQLERTGAMLLIPQTGLARLAAPVSDLVCISLLDAMDVVLAESLQTHGLRIPLIVGDAELHSRLRRRASLSLLWLGDYGSA